MLVPTTCIFLFIEKSFLKIILLYFVKENKTWPLQTVHRVYSVNVCHAKVL